jgi:hypothetical protein
MPLANSLVAILVAVLLSTCVAPPLCAQQDSGTVFRADTRLVVLHASVVDRKGNLVTNLPREAFAVYENGVKQELKIFRREDVPVSFGLVIDNRTTRPISMSISPTISRGWKRG